MQAGISRWRDLVGKPLGLLASFLLLTSCGNAKPPLACADKAAAMEAQGGYMADVALDWLACAGDRPRGCEEARKADLEALDREREETLMAPCVRPDGTVWRP